MSEFAMNAYDVQVEFAGKSSIQAQLFPAKKMTKFQGRKIEKTEVDGFLDLVSIRSALLYCSCGGE